MIIDELKRGRGPMNSIVYDELKPIDAAGEQHVIEGHKDDCGKAGWHLLPFDALAVVVAVLDHGASKYEDRNWEKGMKWSRLFAATWRHGVAWWRGERLDAETGLPHLAHLVCCGLFLLAYELRNAGTDDRP